jgi:hypothetical protein
VPAKDLEQSIKKLDTLANALGGPAEEVPVSLVQLKVALGKQFNLNCTKCVLRLRSDFEPPKKQAILDALRKQEEIIKVAQRKEVGRKITKSLMIEYRVSTFVDKFRIRCAARKKAEQERISSQLQKKTLVLDDDRRLEIEETLPTLRTSHELSCAPCSNGEEFARLRSTIETVSYKKSFFSFAENSLVWKEKITSAKPAGRVQMSRVLDIAVDGDVFVSMVNSLDPSALLTLRCSSSAETRPLGCTGARLSCSCKNKPNCRKAS